MAVASPVYDPFAIGSKKEQDELRKLLWQRTRGDGKLRNDRTISFVRKARKDLVTETIWKRKVTGVEITMNRMERKSKRGEIAVRPSSERNG